MYKRQAYECAVSIILDEQDIEIRQVKVEQVVLNKSGKRAIRLDAIVSEVKQSCLLYTSPLFLRFRLQKRRTA